MTQDIADEIQLRQKKSKVSIAEVHGQEGAHPDIVPGAPTEDELRATPEDTTMMESEAGAGSSSLSELDSDDIEAMEIDM